jgi:hypothetical protein
VPQKITISGDIVGNIDGNLNCDFRYKPFANSYTSRIKSKDILDAIDKSVNISELEYPKQNTDGKVTWISITRENINEYPYLNPLAGFELQNTGRTEVFALSYKDLVWDPSFEEDTTPTRSLMKGALTTTKPTEIDTTLEGTAIFDNPEPIFPPEHDER